MNEHIEDLQIRLTHQEAAIDELTRTVSSQQMLIIELKRELEQVREMLDDLSPSPLQGLMDDSSPPPHY